MSGEAESDDVGSFGNRPATGARLVDNSTELQSSFGGGQEATDFLGLSQDLAGLEPGATDSGATADSGASSGIGPGFGVAPAPENDSSASWLLAPAELAEQKTEDGSGVDADAEAAPEEVEELAPVETGRSRRSLSLAAAVLIIGAAVTIAMKFGAHSKPTELATNTPPVHTPTPKPFELSTGSGAGHSVREGILPNGETVPVTETAPEVTPTETPTVAETSVSTNPEVVPTPTPVSVEPVAVAVEPPRAGAKRLAEWMNQHGWSPMISPGTAPDSDAAAIELLGATSPVGWSSVALLAFATRVPAAMPSAESMEPAVPETPVMAEALPPASITSLSGDASGNPSASSLSVSSGPVPAGAMRLASAEDLAGIWNADTVPMNLLDAETRIVTPAVGAVRVVLKTGEIFDGRLYAVGQGQVWIEMDIGRLALSAKSVLRIDQSISDKESKAIDALPRMRVRTPGGLFFGKVLSRDEHHVTLRLDGGGRITLESSDVEPAPLGDTRVVGTEKP